MCVCVCRWRVTGKIATSAQVCVAVCVTCTTEGEGLTVGDKAGRPAHCDYHPLDPLSLSYTYTHTHAHSLSLPHMHTQCRVLQGFRIDRWTDRQRSLGSQAR